MHCLYTSKGTIRIERGMFLTSLNKHSMLVCTCTINEKVKIVVGAPHYRFVNETIQIVFHSVLNPTTAFSSRLFPGINSHSVSSSYSLQPFYTTLPGLNHHHSAALWHRVSATMIMWWNLKTLKTWQSSVNLCSCHMYNKASNTACVMCYRELWWLSKQLSEAKYMTSNFWHYMFMTIYRDSAFS